MAVLVDASLLQQRFLSRNNDLCSELHEPIGDAGPFCRRFLPGARDLCLGLLALLSKRGRRLFALPDQASFLLCDLTRDRLPSTLDLREVERSQALEHRQKPTTRSELRNVASRSRVAARFGRGETPGQPGAGG